MIYLDHNATTPMLEPVLEAMLPFMQKVGNSSSMHQSGRFMRHAIDEARQKIAALINAHPTDIIFTSGGTEANNLMLKGWAGFHRNAAPTLHIGSTEHDSVLKTARQLSKQGVDVQFLAVNQDGIQIQQPTPSQQPSLCSLMLANNESGVIQDIPALAHHCALHAITLHTDASQALGKIPVDFKSLNVDAMTLSAHKIGGPMGIGALIRKSSLPLDPLLAGGGHQENLRSGTEPIASIVGFAKAAEIVHHTLFERHTHLLNLQFELESGLAQIPGVVVLGRKANRLPNTTLLAVPHVTGEMLVMTLDKAGCAVSSGSACHGHTEGHVVKAMQVSPDLASGVIRISLGIQNTAQEIYSFLQALKRAIPLCQPISSI